MHLELCESVCVHRTGARRLRRPPWLPGIAATITGTIDTNRPVPRPSRRPPAAPIFNVRTRSFYLALIGPATVPDVLGRNLRPCPVYCLAGPDKLSVSFSNSIITARSVNYTVRRVARSPNYALPAPRAKFFLPPDLTGCRELFVEFGLARGSDSICI